MEQGRGGLSEADRRLLDRLVQARARASAAQPDADEREARRVVDCSAWLDFSNLPGYAEQRLLRSAASALGLRDPFFLIHEGDAGASTVIDGRRMINFSSYDYLGLNRHPEVRAAAQAAIDRYGVSAGASRLVAGERPIHRALEAALADHYGQDACVTFVSGHAANVSTISALLGPRDIVVHDALAHNSIVMGAQLSAADRRSFPHNDLSALDSLLQSIRGRYERALIVAEGLYSMDGDVCDLPALVELKGRHQAWLMIDDAHGLGVLGQRGQGVFEHFGVDPRRIDIWMGTLSKTLAACGGFIAGDAALVDFLKHAAGGFVYSVGMPPPVAAAALAALGIVRREPERSARLHERAHQFASACRQAGLDLGTSVGEAIIPVMTGDSIRAAALSQRLAQRNVNVQPIIAPAVPDGLARLRFFLSSEHDADDIAASVEAIAQEFAALSRMTSLATLRGEPGQIAGPAL
jgi:8-amino-7-oxononanoate synthase